MSNLDDFIDGKASPAQPAKKSAVGIDSFLGTPEPSSALRRVGDLGVKAAQGVAAGIPEAAIGLGNILTGGKTGYVAQRAGLDTRKIREGIGQYLSPEQKAGEQAIQQADGFLPSLKAGVTNPMATLGYVAESIPVMLAGGAAGRALTKAAPGVSARVAGAAGEGLTMAGAQAEQIRQQTDDGLLTGKQAALAAGTGVLGAGLGYGGARLAGKLGIGDVDTMVVEGLTKGAQSAVKPGVRGIAERAAKGAVAEGLFEELPQSVMEQGLQNVALDQPVADGMGNAAAMGLLAGGVMGAGAGALTRGAGLPGDQTPPVVPPQPGQPPEAPQAGQGPVTTIPEAAPEVAPDQPQASTLGAPLTSIGAGVLAPPIDPIRSVLKPSEAMGINPAEGPLSKVAAMAVDGGVAPAVPLDSPPAQRAQAPQINLDAMAGMSDDDLRGYLRNAQDTSIRKAISSELVRRKQAALQAMPDPLQPSLIDQPQGEPTRGTQTAQAQQTEAQGPKAADANAPGVLSQQSDQGAVNASQTETTAAVAQAPAAREPSGFDSERERGPAQAVDGRAVGSGAGQEANELRDANVSNASEPVQPGADGGDRVGRADTSAGVSAGVGVAEQPARPMAAANAELDQAGDAGGEPGRSAAGSPAALTPEFVTTKTVYGDTVRVLKSDLDGDRKMMPTFTEDGKRKIGKVVMRDNLDPTGEKLAKENAEDASNPLFNTITSKDGAPFFSQLAAKREMNRRGLADTYAITPAQGAKGFVLTRKAQGTDVQNAPQGTAGEAQAPAIEAPEAARGDDAAAAGVPAEAGAGAAQADGVKKFSVGTFDSWRRQGMSRGTVKGWTIFQDPLDNTYRLARKGVKERNQAGGGYVEGEIVEQSFASMDDAKAWASQPKLEATKATDVQTDGVKQLAEEAKIAQAETARVGAISQDLNELQRVSEAEDAANERLSGALESIPDDQFGVQAKTTDGRKIILTPSAQKPGQWQLTRFARDGAPWGDSQYTSKKSAILDFLREVDIGTLETAAQSQPKTETQPKPSNDAGSVSQQPQESQDAVQEQGKEATEATIKPSEMYRRLQQLSARANRKPYTPLTDDEFKAVVDAGLATGKKWATGKLNTEGYGRLAQLEADETESSNARADAEDLIAENLPFKASAVDQYGLDVPDGYVRQGSMFVRDSAQQEAQQPTQAEQKGEGEKKPSEKIEDFGEKIGGAKKDLWTSFKDGLEAVSDEDIAGQPLSKIWPAPDYQALIDSGTSPEVVAFIRAARDEIPAKPRVGYKVKGWAGKVKVLRGLALDMMAGKVTMKDVQAQLDKAGALSRSMQGFMGRVELYQAVGHDKSLEGISMSWHNYALYRGQKDVSMWVVEQDAKATAWGSFPRELATGKTKEEAIEGFKKVYGRLGSDKEAKKGVQFEIISFRGEKGYWIAKKLGRNHIKIHGPLETVQQAREYRDNNQAELVAKLEKIKEIPNERRDTNEPRVGEDMRNGADVTPEMFAQTFGFRGVEFGNWVEQGRRQRDLNDAFDALMDMAAVLGIPPKAISLNGQLGLAFGARGTGGSGMVAAAHYEPDKVVINLTKKNGAGSLGHEWWHAVDNHLSKRRKQSGSSFMTTARDVLLAARDGGYMPYEGVRPEVVKAFGNVVKSINMTGMKKRAAVLDGKRAKEYWTTGEEMSARAFEAYLISKLQDQNASNDYLANIVREEVWNAAAALGLENENSYPYPTQKEIPGIRAAFDELFQTIQTRETDGGNVEMFSIAEETASAYADRIDALFAGEPASRIGVKAMDSSDVMTMLGYESKPVLLAESKVIQGMENHPEMTAEVWKKVPEWLDNPAAVFDSDTDGGLVVIVPEIVAGKAVSIIVRPDGERRNALNVHLLLNAYTRSISTPYQRWISQGLLRYVDQKKFPALFEAVAGRQLPSTALQNKPGTNRILTEKNLAGYRKESLSIADEAPPFYSALSREIAKSPMKQGFAPAWNQYLDALAKRGAIKADEVEWTGLREWLNLQDGKVTKDQIAEYLDANGVQVTETVLGGSEPQVITSDEALDRLRNNLPVGWRRGDQVVQMHSPDSIVDDRSYYRELVDDGEAEWIDTGTNVGGEVTQTKYGDYTLPGGTNYREVLLTLPMRSADAPKGEVKYDPAGDAAYPWAIIVNGKEVNRSSDEATAPDILQEEIDRAAKKVGYRSSHWDQKNVLAHIRVNDRVDADGNRVLFVEELQSDFGQDIKKKGMASKVMTEAQRAAKLAEAKALNAGIRQRTNADRAAGLEQISDETLKLNTADSIRAGEIMRELEDDKAAALANTAKLPRAPFVDKTDKWLALSLKRIMKMAVDGGYDRVAFVNGEQSADRYDLSKQVDQITYEGGVLRAFQKRTNVITKKATPEELPDLIGKEVAQRLLDAPMEDGRRVLMGESLKVGGEGMKAFYDRIVPAAVKDVLKKVGGGQMEAVDIGITKGEKSEYSFGPFKAEDARIIERAPGVFQVWVKNPSNNVDQVRGGNFKTRAAAEQFIADMAPGQTQPGFTITPQMREKVAGGLPLFSAVDGQAQQADTADYGPATQAHRETVAKIRDALNERRVAAGRRPLVWDAVSPADGAAGRIQRAVAAVAKRFFNVEVIWVDFRDGALFNGAVSKSAPGKILLNIRSTRPYFAVLGHELLHHMAKTQPKLYAELSRKLDKLIKNESVYAQQLRAKYEKQGLILPDGSIREELEGDIVGDNFDDSLFWQALSEGQPSLFKRITQAIVQWLDGLASKIGKERPFGTDEFLTDIAAARAAVADAMRQFSGTEVGAVTDGTDVDVSLSAAEKQEQTDIRFSIADAVNDPREVAKGVRQILNDSFKVPGRLSWWHKTVGTQWNLAERVPEFKRVFDAAQDFLDDVSFYGAEAAKMAPKIIPKLETWKDLGKKPISGEDNKAIAAPIFEGTLTWGRDESGRPVRMAELEAQAAAMTTDQKARRLLRNNKITDQVLRMWQGMPQEQYEAAINSRYASEMLRAGVVWTDDELSSLFKLTPDQIGLYREFRAATDKSLGDLALSDIVQFAGKDVEPIKDMVMGRSLDDASEMVRDYLLTLAENDPDRADILTDTANRVIDKAERAKDLMKRGYAPLQRFGRHTVYATTPDGEQLYFGMYENRFAAAQAERQLRATYPDAVIDRGVMSQEAYKQFQGISPETLELFGEMLGLEADGSTAESKAFQTYLKLAKSNRSAMKRLIERKGIAGFSEDAGRVLAAFLYSNARQTSANLHTGSIVEGVRAIPKGMGDVQDAAQKLATYIMDPQEEAAALRGMLFAQYLGGSIASAAINALQPAQVTFPYLSQFVGVRRSASLMTAAVRDALKPSTGDKRLDAALLKAEEDGVVSPQEIHQLMAQAQGKATLSSGDGTRAGNSMAAASNLLSRLSLGWGKVFSVPEQFNRRSTFIAAYRAAVENGMGNPAQFAERAVKETQFVYNKGCVDEDTECLTLDGWKRHSSLAPGELVYAVDAKTGELVESTLVDVHRYTGTGGYSAIHFTNANGFSMMLTPEHKCLVQNYSSRDKKYQRPRLVRADSVKVGHHFVRTPQGDATGRAEVYSDDEVQLFAWVAAEGCLFAHRNCVGKRGVNLSQSMKHNPHYVAEIDALLDRLGGHHSRHIIKGGDMVSWTLRKPLWSKIHEALPGKMIGHDLVRKLTARQMTLFLHTFAKADGHIADEGGPTITQKDCGNLNALQAMAVLSGQSSTLYERMGKHEFGALYIAKNSKRAYNKELTKTNVMLPMVWCPETEHGTWIARRNGRTFVTGNSKPTWARGAVGGTIFTFKQYSISYMELMSRMATQGGPEGKRAALLMLGVLFVMAGAGGMPGVEDAEDLVDGIAQRVFGLNWQTRQKREEWLTNLFGAAGARFVENGISGLPWSPTDVSGRLGLGNLIPGTGIFVKKSSYGRDVADIVGPVGDFARRIAEGAGHLLQGNVLKAAEIVSPVAVRNAVQGARMAANGQYDDQRGRKVIETTPGEAALKSVGFQPHSVARVQDASRQVQQMVTLNRLRESEIADAWAKAIVKGDDAGVQKARAMLADWNRANPDAPIRITFAQIRRRVQALQQDRATRLQRASPVEIRGQVARELAQAQ